MMEASPNPQDCMGAYTSEQKKKLALIVIKEGDFSTIATGEGLTFSPEQLENIKKAASADSDLASNAEKCVSLLPTA